MKLSSHKALAVLTALSVSGALLAAEGPDTNQRAQIYRDAARIAAGTEHASLLQSVCPDNPRIAAATPSPDSNSGTTARPTRLVPPIETWYREPAQVFDELYFVGTDNHSSWAVVTDEGIMLLDTVFDFATGDAIVGGLKKLGFDPADIKYVFISHGHGDHHGGAKYLQDEFNARIIMGAQDWDLVASNNRDPAPRRDIVATDGLQFKLGNTTVTLIQTPGHTEGTFSSMVTVQDNGETHTAVSWGGTAIWPRTPTEQVQLYIDSAVRFRNMVQTEQADVLIANHLVFDNSREKLAQLSSRQIDEPHPYVVGTDVIARYLTVAENCARAELAYR